MPARATSRAAARTETCRCCLWMGLETLQSQPPYAAPRALTVARNIRSGTAVTDMRWAPDGGHICVAYADGMALVGGSQGEHPQSKSVPS
ncbi:hypothetical protein WJX81_005439 [Elliptochloris bilobata]|uniref:Anaphase-promoting complex subunit 4 WD40 domain-containing protein n=1 Tax=Elliptochloris bilobata TaxID=381761 RepID=A0AAW1QNT1_9CHLO